jgi:hypothetical protein
MPCWQTNTMSVQFSAKHIDVLKRAVDALDWTIEVYARTAVVWTKTGDRIEIDMDMERAMLDASIQSQLNQLKVAYSQQALKKAAKAKGWQQHATSQQKGYLYR